MTESLGLGSAAMWGFSPALDLLGVHMNSKVGKQATEDGTCPVSPINILLANPADVRHLLRTIAMRKRHFPSEDLEQRPIHFYIWDRPIEVHARHLALMQLARDPDLPIRQRASLWLEVYGNALVQERTERLIGELGKELVRLVCDGKGLLAPVVDLSLLRFREKDGLEATFKTWAPQVPFDVAVLRDTRLRRYYEQRYDQRKNIVDWDYHEGVKPVASIVHYKQYLDWRMTGVAFEFGDQSYTRPNRTMASYTEGTMCKGKDRGMKKEVRGYWVDLVIGPFFALGADCEKPNKFAEDLFLVHNKGTGCAQHRHHAVEVAVYNIVSYLWETETGTQYRMTREHEIYSGLGEKKEGVQSRSSPDAASDPDTQTGAPPLEHSPETQRVQELSPAEFDKLLKVQRRDISDAETRRQQTQSRTNGVTVPESPRATVDCEERRTSPVESGPTDDELEKIAHAYEGVKIFLLGDNFRAMYTKKRFQDLFDVAFVSVGASHFLSDADLNNILSPHGADIIVENAKYIVPLNMKSKIDYVNKIKAMAKQQGWEDDFGNKRRNIEDLKLRDSLPFVARPRIKTAAPASM